MEDIRQIADKISEMSDAELDAAIRSVGSAMGVDARTLDRMSREKGLLRRKMSAASDRDLEKIASRLTPEQIGEIKRNVNGGGK